MKFDIGKLMTLKGAKLILAGAAAGIALIILGFLLPSSESEQDKASIKADKASVISEEESLETKLTTLISRIDGAGSVYVAVTYENSGESIYAYDCANNGDSVAVVRSSSSYEEPLIEQVLSPEVRGVAVVCGGGDDPAVQLKIIRLLSALLGIPSQRICVTS